MKELDISLLLKKAEELKALFTLAQRVIPFLEEIFIFIKDIKPLLDEINLSIQENLKKMPNASKQLSKVTEATELATTEIMDIVDGLVYKADIISNNIHKLSNLDEQRKSSPIKMFELMQTMMNQDADVQDILPQMTSSLASMRGNANKEFQETINSTDTLLQSIKDDSSSIMMSLQMQDITSQQIAAVNHLLETIQAKLAGIMGKFQSSELAIFSDEEQEKMNVSQLHRKIAFDPDAIDSMTNKNRQNEIDQFIGQQTSDASSLNEPASVDDIDSMFASNNNGFNAETEPEINIPASNTPVSIKPSTVEEDFEQFSQDDIDALFSNT